MKPSALIPLLAAASVLVACGGGGGATSAAPAAPAPAPAPAAAPASTVGTAATAKYDLATAGIPKFVSANYIDLSKVTRVSRLRSSAGHDYGDSAEQCRSMKHYFSFPDQATAIYSPVDGSIVKMDEERAGGIQVRVRSSAQPAFTFVIFHVNPASAIMVGKTVSAGQTIGTHIGSQTGSDIAVEVDDNSGRRLVSYFDTLTDAAFAPFRARGISSPSQLVITRAERDAAPLSCVNEGFVGTDPLPAWIDF